MSAALRRWAVLVLAIAVAVELQGAAIVRAEALDDAVEGPAVIGEPRPALELDALDGSLVTSPRVTGQILLIDFFATWCQPCRRAHDDLRAALQDAALPGVRVLLVDLGEPAAVVRRWAADTALPPGAIIALDPNGVAARRWGANRLPTTFIVDATGVVRHINRGWGPGYRARLSRWLRAMRPPAAP